MSNVDVGQIFAVRFGNQRRDVVFYRIVRFTPTQAVLERLPQKVVKVATRSTFVEPDLVRALMMPGPEYRKRIFVEQQKACIKMAEGAGVLWDGSPVEVDSF